MSKLTYHPPNGPGKRAKANEDAAKRNWPKVLQGRARYRCEVCGAQRVQLEGHHIGGRPGSGLCLGPLANRGELLTALCRECHQNIHAEPLGEKRFAVLYAAVLRLGELVLKKEPLPSLTSSTKRPSTQDLIDALRELIRRAEESGIEAQEDRQ